jgi:micrococcal nuclease
VQRVVDGDTFDIDPSVEGADRVRLIGVDTPEANDPECGEQPLAAEAREFTTTELDGQEVDLEFDEDRTDRYGRLLAYVYKDDVMFNETLLEEGLAQVYTFQPNTRYEDRLRAAQEEARTRGEGLWSLSSEEQDRLTDQGNGIGGDCAAETVQPEATTSGATTVPRPAPPPSPSPRPAPTPSPSLSPGPRPTPQPAPVSSPPNSGLLFKAGGRKTVQCLS